MPFSDYLSYLPSLHDVVAPAILGCLLWAIKKASPYLLIPVIHLAKGWILRDLKKARKIRRDPIAIQRQLAKEGALFAAFLVTSSVTLGALTVVLQGKSYGLQAVYWSIFMGPVLALEWWWLTNKMFNDDLLIEASRLGPNFRRLVKPRQVPPQRLARRVKRQEQIKQAYLDLNSPTKKLRRGLG